MSPAERASVVLIGPSGAGKTTIAALLAAELGMVALDLDEVRWDYWGELGYDAAHAGELRRGHGIAALADYWKPFEVHSVERVLADRPRGRVIAFGGGSSVHDNPLHFARVQNALRPFPYVLLLQPSPDPTSALDILTRRLRQRPTDDSEAAGRQEFREINRMFLEHPSNARLATHTIITAGRTPEQLSRDLATLIRAGHKLS